MLVVFFVFSSLLLFFWLCDLNEGFYPLYCISSCKYDCFFLGLLAYSRCTYITSDCGFSKTLDGGR